MKNKSVKRQLSNGPFTTIEQHTVKRLVPLIPRKISPNHLTYLNGITGILAGLFYALTVFKKELIFIASLFIFLHWAGDALDGALARYRKTPSRLGFYLDHFLDAVTVLCIFAGLYISNLTITAIPLIFACLYLLMEIHVLLQAILFNRFKISISFFGPAEAQFFLILGSFIAYFSTPITTAFWGIELTSTFLDVGILAASLVVGGACVSFLIQTARHVRKFDSKT